MSFDNIIIKLETNYQYAVNWFSLGKLYISIKIYERVGLMLYFAYASNLSKEYMKSRCGDAIPLKKVYLKNYKLVFNELADIIQNDGGTVIGALYLISKQELVELDRLEGYPDLYTRIVIEVEDDKGNKYDAFAYIMVDKKLESPPDHYYLTLKKGYEDWDLPLEFLENARDMK
ncbi:gamma-glutamylcyclotransferase [Tissierella creatinini]|nr:gamma-glutamylcyclotransferase [Tissierella creatinini]TJX66648.1 gamma-glutamylcyclotransferase [Soehngenia saccharolytica]